MVLRRHHRDHHRRLGLAEQLCHHRAKLADRFLEPRGRDWRGPVPEALHRRQIGRGQIGMIEQHVDQRRRQEGVGRPVTFGEGQEFADVGIGHDHDFTAMCHDREGQHPGGVGERRHREIDRATLERIAHQGERGHRLEIAARQHHALRVARRAAGAGEHREVADRLRLKPTVGNIRQPLVERRCERLFGIQADKLLHLGQLPTQIVDQIDELRMEEQRGTIEIIENIGVLGRLVARVDRAPDRPGTRDGEDAAEGEGIVTRQDRDMLAGRDAGAVQRVRDAVGQRLHLRIGQALAVHCQAGGVGAQRRPLVEPVDQPHQS